MGNFSYNEENRRQLELRHLFFPGWWTFAGEAVVAFLALISFNISRLSDQLLSRNFYTMDPLALWSNILRQLLDSLGRHYGAQTVVLFGLWAMVGALIYIFIFRCAQLFLGAEHSVSLGIRYTRQEHGRGLMLWLGSLHNFFVYMVITIVGTLALLSGVIVCFGIASQELNNGLTGAFPANIEPLLLSLIGAVLSVRLTMLGFCLLSRHFRRWYIN